MAKLTREQYNKWNAQAKNGFKFDIEYYLTWGEKILIKEIPQEDNSIIQFRLWYYPEYETKINNYGCKWNTKTGRQIPMLKIEKLIPSTTGGVYIVHTIKDNKQVGEPENTLKYATLCKISGLINTEEELKNIIK